MPEATKCVWTKQCLILLDNGGWYACIAKLFHAATELKVPFTFKHLETMTEDINCSHSGGGWWSCFCDDAEVYKSNIYCISLSYSRQ